jgi:hypothetical protein
MHIRKTVFACIIIIVLAIGMLAGEIMKTLGTLDSPDTPQNTNSYTLEDIFNRLSSGTAGSSSAFTEPSSGPGSTMYDMNAIMDAAPEADNTNGATAAEVFSGKTFWGLNSGEWGLQSGTYDVPLVRFTDNGDSTVTDNQTGLMWTKNANLPGYLFYSQSIDFCNTLTFAGYTDWRMPEIWELFSLVDKRNSNPALPSGHPFINVITDDYCSNTISPELIVGDQCAWQVAMDNGYVGFASMERSMFNTWPVRDGQ